MIIELEEAKLRLKAALSDTDDLKSALKIEKLRETARELEEKSAVPNFWDDAENSAKVMRELTRAKGTISEYEKLCSDIEDAIVLAEMGIEDGDESLIPEVLSEEKRLTEKIDSMRIETLLSGEYDHNNAILSLHPGAGGTEAQDWALMLYRMYTRWAEKHGFNVKLVDWLDGDEAGLKSATVVIEGDNAYGYLKSEHGVHRLVRISPFDASGRRHTSFASCEVMPEIEDDTSIEIRDEDIEVTAHRSSGAGGQHINKTDSAIRIVHKPTGIVVGCQTERSQVQNKETAMRMLRSKLAEIKQRENLERIEDIRGEKVNIEWGSQIRSYVFMPYTLAKDTRTGYETGNIGAVMDGDIDGFINAFLKMKA
ncbi:MAG: peptide chain release factor 2 [Clostridiales bacterium]|nr:peptide chain release factor 2 [Clostridiales bacterium]